MVKGQKGIQEERVRIQIVQKIWNTSDLIRDFQYDAYSKMKK